MGRPPYPIGKRRRLPDGRWEVKDGRGSTGWTKKPKTSTRRRPPRLEIALPADALDALQDAADALGGVTGPRLAQWVLLDWLSGREIREILSEEPAP
jgi:hypothetical protein